jgi:hypothetical protein
MAGVDAEIDALAGVGPPEESDAPTAASGSPAPVDEAPVEAGISLAPSGGPRGALSDDDVDRIARRVVELMSEGTVREVAWEVVPDLAEVVIKKRLRDLERQAD